MGNARRTDRLIALLAMLILLGLGGTLIEEAFHVPAAPALRDTPPGSENGGPSPPIIETGRWVIPPGREAAAMGVLQPALQHGVGGHSVASVQIRGSEIHVLLEDGGLLVLGAEGILEPTFTVQFQGISEDAAIRTGIESEPAGTIFTAREALLPAGDSRASAEADLEPPRFGLLTPTIQLLEVTPRTLIVGTLLLGLFLSLGLAHTLPPSTIDAISKPSGWIIAGFIIAIALRVAWAMYLPPETDEVLPLTNGMPLVSFSHDSLIHPPLYRAVALSWVRLTNWQVGDSIFTLRIPSIVASTGGAAFLLLAVLSITGTTARATLGTLPALVGPSFVAATVLARPYAISTLLAGIALWSVSAAKVTRERAAVALLAAGLSFWGDVLGGTALAVLVALWFAQYASPRSTIGAILALSFFAAPLALGVVEAATHSAVDPGSMSVVLSAEHPSFGMARGGALAFVARLLSYCALGTNSVSLGLPALLLLLGSLYFARQRWGLLAALVAMFLLALVVGTHRSIRPRNLVELPMLFALVAAIATSPGSHDRETRS